MGQIKQSASIRADSEKPRVYAGLCWLYSSITLETRVRLDYCIIVMGMVEVEVVVVASDAARNMEKVRAYTKASSLWNRDSICFPQIMPRVINFHPNDAVCLCCLCAHFFNVQRVPGVFTRSNGNRKSPHSIYSISIHYSDSCDYYV